MKTDAKKSRPLSAAGFAEEAKKLGAALSANQKRFFTLAFEKGAELEPAGALAGVGR